MKPKGMMDQQLQQKKKKKNTDSVNTTGMD